MNPSLQEAIERKNKQAAAEVRSRFAKKATDGQLLDKLAESAKAMLAEYDKAGADMRGVVAELRKDIALAERRRK